MDQTFRWGAGVTVRLCIPTPDDVIAWLEHCGAVELPDVGDDPLGPDGGGPFTHPVWWVSPDQCPCGGGDLDDDAGDTLPEQCIAGRVTLGEVLAVVDRDAHQAIVDAHLAAMTAAWDHYWSGDGLQDPDRDAMGSACPGCLVEGAAHIARVGGEAEDLAVELGAALGAYHGVVLLGDSRYPDTNP